MSNTYLPFIFKQFTITQNCAAMKVGTDGVLLGAWAPIPIESKHILDIGTGTGLIALQCAQRHKYATIDAVEIDPDAVKDCTENFNNSKWKRRLQLHPKSIQDFAQNTSTLYNAILTNPPYYNTETQSIASSRNIARTQQTLSFEVLFKTASTLLTLNGVFSVVVPHLEASRVIAIAKQYKLFVQAQTLVKGQINSAPKRHLIAFGFHQKKYTPQELIIEISRHNYTQAYKTLVSDFYLKM